VPLALMPACLMKLNKPLVGLVFKIDPSNIVDEPIWLGHYDLCFEDD